MKKQGIKILLISCVFLLLGVMIVPIMTAGLVTIILGGGNEEESVETEADASYVSLLVSDQVERYRSRVLEEAVKEKTEAYIELFLAVMQQESGGNGEDVFQASESKGLAPNTLKLNESIQQGVKYLSAMIKKAGCTSPSDLEHIRLALQGYNFGGAYIDYAIQKDGGWTQENTFAYAKDKSGGKKNSGTRAQVLGPWRYGDQYYTAHVLRYYSADVGVTDEKDMLRVPLDDRMKWLFPQNIPTTQEEMKPYLQQIKVVIYTTKKKKGTMTLVVHKKLAKQIQAVFKEMYQKKFPVDPTCTAGYVWRNMASDSSKLSYHSYGCVVDLNWTHNGAVYTSWPYNPGKDKLAVTEKIVAIWKKHGFYWGGDWSQGSFDPMHFTYVNH